MIGKSFFTFAVGAPFPPALLGGGLCASLFHPKVFQEVVVALLDFRTGIKKREREDLATGVGMGAQGIKGMLILCMHARAHTHTHTHAHTHKANSALFS